MGDTTRWLDRDEQAAWRAYLESGRLLFRTLDAELQRDVGIPHAYYEILVRLSEAPQRTLRMSELADASLSSRSRLSHAVDRLEEQGWVERARCGDDRRGTYAILTDAGFAALDSAAPTHVGGVREHVFDQLDPDQVSQLHDISRAILAHLTGDDSDRSPRLPDDPPLDDTAPC